MMIDGISAGALILIAVKTIVDIFSKDRQKNTDALTNATHAIVKLEVKLDNLAKMIEPLPEMQKDLNGLHEKGRYLEEEVKTIKAMIRGNQ